MAKLSYVLVALCLSMVLSLNAAADDDPLNELREIMETSGLSRDEEAAFLSDLMPLVEETLFLRKAGGDRIGRLDQLLMIDRVASEHEFPGDMFAEDGTFLRGDLLVPGDMLLSELDSVTKDLYRLSQNAAEGSEVHADFAQELERAVQRLVEYQARVESRMHAVSSPDTSPPESLHLRLPKTVYTTDEPIIAQFFGLPGNDQDWLAIARRGSDSNRYNQWSYTRGAVSGEIEFRAQQTPGEYEIRVFYDWRGTTSYEIEDKLRLRVVEP